MDINTIDDPLAPLIDDLLIDKFNLLVAPKSTMIRDPASALVSQHYYSSLPAKVTSIYLNLVKGHYFSDGNKRTACLVLLYLAEELDLRVIYDEALYDMTIRLAKMKKMDAAEAMRLLFVL